MGEHMEVSQYMVEQGGLSITGIQDIAALKIQVRKRHMDDNFQSHICSVFTLPYNLFYVIAVVDVGVLPRLPCSQDVSRAQEAADETRTAA